MRTVRAVTIKNAIVHSLDNGVDSARLSDYELDLDEKVTSFISTHVLKSLEDEKIRAAKYEVGRNIVRDSTDSIFDFPEKFLVESKEIAKQLFTAMQTNKKITSADLIISLYEGNGVNYLAVLKMDYQSTYITESRVIGGKTRIVLTDKGISLPNVRQKLQKCVFFRKSSMDTAVDTENTYDMLLIDRQARQESERDIAQYFAASFLKCKLVMNEKDRTKKFHLKVKKFANEFLGDQPEEQKRVLDSLESVLKHQQRVSAIEFSNNLFPDDEEQKKSFLDFLVKEGLPDFEFAPDREYVQARYKIRKIKTSEKIEVSLPDEDYNNPEKFSYEPVEGDRFDLTIKNVKVTDWGG